MVALVRSEVVRPGRIVRVLGRLAIIGTVRTVPGELVLIPVAGSNIDAASTTAPSTLYGVAVLLADIGLIGVRRPGIAATSVASRVEVLPLLLGLFQLLVVTRVLLVAGFASTAAFVVITISDLLTGGISLALVREPSADEWPASTQAVRYD
jgi:hypothetical protein